MQTEFIVCMLILQKYAAQTLRGLFLQVLAALNANEKSQWRKKNFSLYMYILTCN